jgi:hypothetical protein
VSAEPRTIAAAEDECRCLCGSLVARLVEDGVELKCRRCKRTLLVAISGEGAPRSRAARRVRVAQDSR